MTKAVLRVQRDRLSKGLDRGFFIPEPPFHDGQASERFRIIGAQVHRLLELIARSREIMMDESLHMAHRDMRLGQPRRQRQRSFCLTLLGLPVGRSEESRVGKRLVRNGRYRVSPYQLNNKNKKQ